MTLLVEALPVPAERTRPLRLWLPVGLAAAAIAWGGNEFTPLLVLYRHDRGLSLVTVDLMLAAYVVGIIPALVIGGPLSDRYGRRALFLPAPLIGVLGSAFLAAGATMPAMLFVGRIVSGVAIGLAMAVGTSWIKELSTPPWDTSERAASNDGVGARRASLSLTAGFLLGAGVAGVLAQWAPAPEVLPYLVHIALTLPLAWFLLRAPETTPRIGIQTAVAPVPTDRTVVDRRHSALRDPHFLRLVLPTAPWVFGCAGVAYAVLPGLVSSHVGGLRVAFSALATVITLGSGVLVQPFARRLDRRGSARTLTIALAVTAVGMALATLAAGTLAVPLALLAAAVLGCAYGIHLVAGLLHVQRIAPAGDLAGLTAAFYTLSYLGFAAPAAMSVLATNISYPVMLSIGAVVAAGSCVALARGGRQQP
ncbi:MAG: putative multidrug resistance transporter, superfamily protein [Ilumatobacteraceae bacterium]|nr:putative multidrug resistance transporter, superfamily protein [Ilumatobacteraceae bacterium]